MLYRIAGGLGLLALGINYTGLATITPVIVGVLLVLGAIGLLAGI